MEGGARGSRPDAMFILLSSLSVPAAWQSACHKTLASRFFSRPLAWAVAFMAAGTAWAQHQSEIPDTRKSYSPVTREQVTHLVSLGASRWQALGWRGQGVRVAILDTGFRGYRQFLGGALPSQVICKSFRADRNLEARDSQHGILCAEVVHALAPEAVLLFANWEADQPEQFLDAVRWARQENARVMTCSIIMPSWSDGEGRGKVDDSLAEILGTGSSPRDPLFAACAGNTAQRHWQGRFVAAADGCHEWARGCTQNLLYPWSREKVSVDLYSHSSATYEVLIENAGSGRRVGLATFGREPNHSWTVVRFEPEEHALYEVRVRLKEGPPGHFHVAVLGGDLGCSVAAGSVACPADCFNVLAIGAVDLNGQRFAYSSCGSCGHVCKPDLVAPVPFPTRCRERPFSGTSAAAPQGAGLAALCWSKHPEWNANQVRSFLLHSAHDVGTPGPDSETGLGMLVLPPCPP
jgi:subtilisin family serine protease